MSQVLLLLLEYISKTKICTFTRVNFLGRLKVKVLLLFIVGLASGYTCGYWAKAVFVKEGNLSQCTLSWVLSKIILRNKKMVLKVQLRPKSLLGCVSYLC